MFKYSTIINNFFVNIKNKKTFGETLTQAGTHCKRQLLLNHHYIKSNLYRILKTPVFY